MKLFNSYIKSIKYILALIAFKEEKIKLIEYKDEYYKGIDNKNVELRVFYSKNKKSQSIIIFPGASPYAENHPGMIMLGNAFRSAGYNVFLPRIPTLKALKLTKLNVEWFAHCYSELLKHPSIDKKNILVGGLSYGGANLLKASLDTRFQNNKPKSYLSYGTYFSINTALNFFLTGKISYKNKTYNISPHEWGMIVLFYNFINTIEINNDKEKITEILKLRIEDKEKEMITQINTLNKQDKELIHAIIKGVINNKIKVMVNQIITNNKSLLNYLSPELWANNITDKVFIMHGANDSMVPFTESILLDEKLQNSSIMISFLYEHREISTNRGIIFKLKELLKMIHYFANYFKYNL